MAENQAANTQENQVVNQIAKVQTNKKLIAFYDKLRAASFNNYASIHAKGEKISGRKETSLIGIMMQDYTNGTGNNNIKVSYNISPEQAQFILSRIEAGFQDFDWQEEKIFGDPDNNGYSVVNKITIQRRTFDQSGNRRNSPWMITIQNGKGIKVQNKIGGFHMKGGSYQMEKSVSIGVSEMDMYMLLKRTDAFIRNWESITAAQMILQGKAAFAKQGQQSSRQGQQYHPQPQQDAQYYQVPQQYQSSNVQQNQPQAQQYYPQSRQGNQYQAPQQYQGSNVQQNLQSGQQYHPQPSQGTQYQTPQQYRNSNIQQKPQQAQTAQPYYQGNYSVGVSEEISQ